MQNQTECNEYLVPTVPKLVGFASLNSEHKFYYINTNWFLAVHQFKNKSDKKYTVREENSLQPCLHPSCACLNAKPHLRESYSLPQRGGTTTRASAPNLPPACGNLGRKLRRNLFAMPVWFEAPKEGGAWDGFGGLVFVRSVPTGSVAPCQAKED